MELQQRLNRLVDERDTYECMDKESNRGKRVIAMLGPSAVGKSTLINACIERAPLSGIDSIAEAGTTGTRAPREGDPAGYRMGVPREEAVELIEQGAPTNWSLSPTGEIYMTLPQDFPAQYNFMACLPDSLPMLRRAGFAVVHAVYLVTEVEAWERQLASRLYTADTVNLPSDQRRYHTEARGRVEEALDSLEYVQRETNLLKVSNTPGEEHLATTADIILQISKGQSTFSCGEQMHREFLVNMRAMYSRALDLTWEIEQASAA